MRLTRRGRLCLFLGIGLFASARFLGIQQLWSLACSTLLLVAFAASWTTTRTLRITAQRVIPERFQVGKLGHVVLVLSNTSSRTSPTLAVTDIFDGGKRSAPFLVSPIGANETARAAYKVPTEHRGIFELGPLSATCADPFGIAARSTLLADAQKVLVHPRVHEISALPELGGDSLDTHSPDLLGRTDSSGEFHLLRDYDPSDDLRRVHWKTTARRDRLVVRQDESKRRSPVILLLDERANHHSKDSFETAIEVVASVATSLERSNRPFLVTTMASGEVGQLGQRHLASILDSLAIMQVVSTDRHAQDPSLGGRSGTLIVVTGALTQRDIAVFDPGGRSHTGVAIVVTRPRDGETTSAATIPGRRPQLFIEISNTVDLTACWNSSVVDWNRTWTRTRRSALST